MEGEAVEQGALRHIGRRLERGRDRPIDRKQADKRPKQQCAVDQHAAQNPSGPGPRVMPADRLRRGENGQSSNSLSKLVSTCGFKKPSASSDWTGAATLSGTR